MIRSVFKGDYQVSRVDLQFANASCAHCVRLVSQALGTVNGVSDIEVDQARRLLAVEFDPTFISVDLIRSVMERAGYPTRPLQEGMVPFPTQSFPSQAA